MTVVKAEQERFLAALSSATQAVGVPLTDEQRDLCLRFTERLLTVNETLNLTRITEPEAVAVKHFADSLTLLPALPRLTLGATVMDVGTGAGFPGVPLKIVRPDLKLTLLDSLAKRLTFLKDACAEMGWNDVAFVHARAEDAGRDPRYRDHFDLVTARAVAALPVLLEWCGPLTAVGGRFVALKATPTSEEMDAARPVADQLHLSLLADVALILPELAEDAEPPRRRLLIYEKRRPTRELYPRTAAAIKRK